MTAATPPPSSDPPTRTILLALEFDAVLDLSSVEALVESLVDSEGLVRVSGRLNGQPWSYAWRRNADDIMEKVRI